MAALVERHSATTVADVMTQGVISCAVETPLRAVAALMAERQIHAVFVFDDAAEDDETVAHWGIVSDLDVVAAAAGDVDRLTARHGTVAPLVTIQGTEPIATAARLMAESGVSHLAVVDPSTGRPAGVISTLDVVRALAASR